ncbi:Di-sulfide bridge nucleocytoplasmic transport domain-containing protein [Phascolomyces articulosus]|uniref:Di-sulfide bridge nucleocytoplasmic transport domain-containing protein n=1 Tax=Phascolomyces articulosus TaxID=60185 RepID=A0AAD5K693_9FUNG|nr:Di-sulfide bridge nucleocytoplasmic transport domain-containing protein [Phascolomyces articulosus]
MVVQEEKVLGQKRPFSNNSNSDLPEKYPFTFVPPLLPGEKLFDQDQLNTSFDESRKKLSAASLTHRFRKRATEGRSVQNTNAIAAAPIRLGQTTLNNNNNNNQTASSSLLQSNHNEDQEYSQVIYARHQALSMTMINWLQFIFNSVLTFLILYIIFTVLWTLRHDFRIKTEEFTAGILDEIALCNRNYGINNCHPSTRVPALEEKCNYWESCKNRDPLLITRSKVSAEMAAEILNSFVEPISYKTLFFFTILVIGSLVVSNTAFRMYRKRLLQ